MQGYFVGIDTSMESHVLRMEDGEGKELARTQVENSHAGVAKVADWVLETCPDPSQGVWVATEGIGGWVAPLDALLATRPEFHYVPVSARSVAEHRCHFPEDVTDAGDAAVIADLLRTQVRRGTARECSGWDERQEELRHCARTFTSLTEQKTGVMNQLRALCEQYVPDYLRDEEVPGLDRAALPALLAWCPDPADLIRKPVSAVAKVLRKASRGHYGEAMARHFQSLARQIGKGMPRAIQECIRSLVAQLQQLSDSLSKLEKELTRLLQETPLGRELLSWKGVGVRTTAAYLAEAGDLKRFRDEASLARMSGVTPVRDQSGKRDVHWRGTRYNRRMKRAILQMASARARFDVKSRRYYQTKYQETGSKIRALKGLARYLVRSIYRAWELTNFNHEPLPA